MNMEQESVEIRAEDARDYIARLRHENAELKDKVADLADRVNILHGHTGAADCAFSIILSALGERPKDISDSREFIIRRIREITTENREQAKTIDWLIRQLSDHCPSNIRHSSELYARRMCEYCWREAAEAGK